MAFPDDQRLVYARRRATRPATAPPRAMSRPGRHLGMGSPDDQRLV